MQITKVLKVFGLVAPSPRNLQKTKINDFDLDFRVQKWRIFTAQ